MDQIKGPAAGGQAETLAALRDTMAARSGNGITADPTGANFFRMPTPNIAYGGGYDDLVNAMAARGPVTPPAPAATTSDPNAGAAGSRAFGDASAIWGERTRELEHPSSYTSDAAWQRMMMERRAGLATDEERAAFDAQLRASGGPPKLTYISARGGVR